MANYSAVLITLSYLAIILSAIGGSSAVEFTVTNIAENTPGGARFNADIGAKYTQQILDASTKFTWEIFQQNNPSDRKSVDRVSLFIDDKVPPGAAAYASNNEIHVSASSIEGPDPKTGFTGVVYHEVVHIWQWNGNGQAPTNLTEGIADFVRLKAGYAPSHWVNPGQGDRWLLGYDVTARFLNYCDELRSGTFVAELNRKLRDGYSDSFFEELLGKPVESLWADYKARYSN